MSNRVYSSLHARQADVISTRRGEQRPELQTFKLNIVIPNGPFTGSLYHLELQNSDTSDIILEKLRRFYKQSATTQWKRFWMRTLLCRKVTIETAVLELSEPAPTNHRTYPITVTLLSSRPSQILTAAFHKHSRPPTPLLEGTVNALVLQPALDKARVWYILVSALVIAPLVAVVIAWHTRKIDTGISACVCIFVMVSTVQALVAWAQVM